MAALLHDREGGGNNDLRATYTSGSTDALNVLLGEVVAGDWRLEVSDRAAVDTGTLNNWTLSLDPSAAPIEIAEAPGVVIPDNDPAGVARTLTAEGAASVSTISIDVDITHSFVRDLLITVVSPQGTRVTLQNREGGSANNIDQTFTEATTPGLAVLQGEPISGQWRLEVADLEGADVGKINRWAIRFQGPIVG